MALRGGGRGPRARDEAKTGDRTLLNAVRPPPTPGGWRRRPGAHPVAPAGRVQAAAPLLKVSGTDAGRGRLLHAGRFAGPS